MKRTFKLNGKVFDVKSDIHDEVTINCRDLYSCYDNPSIYKRAIWSEWAAWFMSMNCFRFGVRSFNTFMFTIEALVYVEEFESDCYLLITPTRQELRIIC